MAKKGRKRKNVPREPNGRAQRPQSSNTEPADAVANAARAKIMMAKWGMCKDDAKDPLAGTFIGVLRIQGKISQEQYEAAQTFLRITNDERKRTSSSAAHYETAESVGGILDQDELDKRNRATATRYAVMKWAILAKQNEVRGNLWTALQYCVIEDKDSIAMLGDLREALNVVSRFAAK